MSDHTASGGLVRPDITPEQACEIALDCYGLSVTASELGSNQDRNYKLSTADGTSYVLRIDNQIFIDSIREAQHSAMEACRVAGISVPAMIPGRDGKITQRWKSHTVRLSEFSDGLPLVNLNYFAPVVLQDFGRFAADSVLGLAELTHEGLDRENQWDMRAAYAETVKLAPSITDPALREQVIAVAEEANEALVPLADMLTVQPIHGDLTDDNVLGQVGPDSRVHPHTMIDFGDLSTGWRVAEVAVTVASMLQHVDEQPLRTLNTVEAFATRLHEQGHPMTETEARALWPLVVLRAALLIANGWRQLEIDGDNEYVRVRMAGEQRLFTTATTLPLTEMTEHVCAILGFIGAPTATGLKLQALPQTSGSQPLASLLPGLPGSVTVLDPGVESETLAAGRWLRDDIEAVLAADAFAQGASAAVMPYGLFRLTRTAINTIRSSATFPIDTEIYVQSDTPLAVVAPLAGTVESLGSYEVVLRINEQWALDISGLTPSVELHDQISSGEQLGELNPGSTNEKLAVALRRADVCVPLDREKPGDARLVEPERAPAWSRMTHDPAALLGLTSLAQRDEAGDEQLRREHIFASAQERYYERPMQIERGWQHHLVDTTGRAYIDMVNNVTGIGHGHPRVADVANRQMRLLGTNSRFLYRSLAEYSERLLATLPEGSDLDTVLLVNSGSEAVDLALRLAQATSGRQTIVSLREAYHGWTMASDAVTTSASDNRYALETRPDWVHIAEIPNVFRGPYRGSDAGDLYARDLGADLEQLEREGRPVAGFICESVLGNAGGITLPEGYLADVYSRVRAAGGVVIADEVQVGLGRMGTSFWGFEQSSVQPDIITIAKPMGNGFPIGGVITSKRVADALTDQGQFFSSAGGNPVSCEVGLAVLDIMREEGLQENARVVGEHLKHGFSELAEKHQLIGPVYGHGLYLGVELVRDRETLEPATEEAAAICERLRELGVIVLTTSERSNVLKIKPPLCLTIHSADTVLTALDRVLTHGW